MTATGRLVTVEQDTDAEIAQCVYALLATEPGQRVELPEYGLEDQAFREGGADLTEIRAEIEEWEPRAEALTDDEIDDLTDKVQVNV